MEVKNETDILITTGGTTTGMEVELQPMKEATTDEKEASIFNAQCDMKEASVIDVECDHDEEETHEREDQGSFKNKPFIGFWLPILVIIALSAGLLGCIIHIAKTSGKNAPATTSTNAATKNNGVTQASESRYKFNNIMSDKCCKDADSKTKFLAECTKQFTKENKEIECTDVKEDAEGKAIVIIKSSITDYEDAAKEVFKDSFIDGTSTQGDLFTEEAEITELKTDRKDLKEENKTLKVTNTSLKNDKTGWETKYNDLKSEATTVKVETLTNDNATLTNDNAKLKKEKTELIDIATDIVPLDDEILDTKLQMQSDQLKGNAERTALRDQLITQNMTRKLLLNKLAVYEHENVNV